MATTVDIGTLITRRDGVKGGRPIIAGTGTSVLAILELYREGYSAEGIVEQLPYLSVEAVFAALAYIHANPAEIAEYLREDEEAHEASFGRP